MSCFKFNLAVVALLFSASAISVERFTSKECLLSEYDTKVLHKGNFWGLMKSDLVVKKDVCKLVVLDEGILDREWKIDVCREPIHIKAVSKGSLSVHKRSGECEASNAKASEFCESWSQLQETLEDKGLIFAEGEREKLDDSHGKVYCAYLLLKKHLGEGVLFSKYQKPVDIYKNGLGRPGKKAKQQDAKESEKKVEAQGRF